jgi:hypothetical protein
LLRFTRNDEWGVCNDVRRFVETRHATSLRVCNNVMGYHNTVQRCRDGACPVRTNDGNGHNGDVARPVPTNERWHRKNLIQYHINHKNHSSDSFTLNFHIF